MIKKLVLFLMLSLTLATALVADNIGFIDMERLISNYKGAQKIQVEMREKLEDYQKIVAKKQEKIEKAKKNKKSEKEIEKLVTEIEEELKPKQEELRRFESDAHIRLMSKITETAKLISKEYGIDVVLDKRVVYVGGFDLTNFILEKLSYYGEGLDCHIASNFCVGINRCI